MASGMTIAATIHARISRNPMSNVINATKLIPPNVAAPAALPATPVPAMPPAMPALVAVLLLLLNKLFKN